MEKAALAVELGIDDDGQIIFQTHPVREPPQGAGRAKEIPELPGTVQRDGVVINVVMDMGLVRMGGNEKGVSALRPAHGRFVSHTVCLLGGDLTGLERLADLIAEHIGIPPLLSARDGLVLCLG